MKISIIIPVYNEEKTVAEIINRVKRVPYPGKKEIIVIDDGSTDMTQKVLRSTHGITLLNNKQNRGKGYSLRKGFSTATGDIILIQDADLEYDPNDHLKMIKLFDDNSVNIVYGSRFLKPNHKPRYTIYYYGNIFLSFITKILYGNKITDMETCYKSFRREVLTKITLNADRFDIEPELTCKLLKNGYKIVEVPIKYKSRSYSYGKKIGVLDGLYAIYVLLKLKIN